MYLSYLCTELAYLGALKTETSLPDQLVSVPIFLLWVLVAQMSVCFCLAAWARLSNLLLALHAVVSFTE
jgi:hypothetical protein